MRKNLLLLVLVSALMLGSGGCTSMFKKEYLSVSEYTEEDHREFLRDAIEISGYRQLRSEINRMVLNHKTEERFIFTDYDGVIESDLAQACWEIRDDTALGSYTVEYMSHYLTRIITYYEATVTIRYKRTAADVNSIINISDENSLPLHLDSALNSLDTDLAFRLNSKELTEGEVRLALDRAFGSNPLSCIESPVPEISIHPASGIDRILEIKLTYPLSYEKLLEQKPLISDKIDSIFSSLTSTRGAAAVQELKNILASGCVYDPDGSQRAEQSELDINNGSTLYGALAEGFADSRGMALAYSALCNHADVECILVTGTLDNIEHCWNIVKLGDGYYHVDVSASAAGNHEVFLCSDAQMRGSYRWNIEDYPECADTFVNSPDFSDNF